VRDDEFDRIFPEELRVLSDVHWTPVAVALRVAQLLAPTPGRTLLDVGAGVGKACLIGAMSSRTSWCGVEQDRAQVVAAILAAQELGLERQTHFVHGDATEVDWSRFDGFYFYNPFGAILTGPAEEDRLLRRALFGAQVTRVEAQLARTRIGTRVVTFHGFGGEMPDAYELISREDIELGELRLYVRTR
jgi:predicted RNA methylase